MFHLAFVAGSLQGHWWGFVSRNYVVWPIFFLTNVFIAFKGTHFFIFIFLRFCACRGPLGSLDGLVHVKWQYSGLAWYICITSMCTHGPHRAPYSPTRLILWVFASPCWIRMCPLDWSYGCFQACNSSVGAPYDASCNSCSNVAATDFGSWLELQSDAIPANDANQEFWWETEPKALTRNHNILINKVLLKCFSRIQSS